MLLLSSVGMSCSTEVELEGPWKDIPVVYGFLSQQDTAHYLRIEKAFLPNGGNALEVAQIADSLYYDTVLVQLEKVGTGQLFELERVDGNAEGYPRAEGIYADAPNYLYKIKASEIGLEGGETVRLMLQRREGAPPVTAETTVLEEIEPRRTSPVSPVNMDYDRQVNFTWSVGPHARIFDVRLVIHYRESAGGDPDGFQPQAVEWVLDDALIRTDDLEQVRISISGEDFYRFLGQTIPVRPEVVRIFNQIDLEIAAAGPELVELLRVNGVNLGLTSFQSVPVYTNLSEGRGIFSSRSRAARRGMTLNSESLDSLRSGIYTRSLNFR